MVFQCRYHNCQYCRFLCNGPADFRLPARHLAASCHGWHLRRLYHLQHLLHAEHNPPSGRQISWRRRLHCPHPYPLPTPLLGRLRPWQEFEVRERFCYQQLLTIRKMPYHTAAEIRNGIAIPIPSFTFARFFFLSSFAQSFNCCSKCGIIG